MCFSIIYAVIITHVVMRWWKGMDFLWFEEWQSYSKSLAQTHTHTYMCTLYHVIITRLTLYADQPRALKFVYNGLKSEHIKLTCIENL